MDIGMNVVIYDMRSMGDQTAIETIADTCAGILNDINTTKETGDIAATERTGLTHDPKCAINKCDQSGVELKPQGIRMCELEEKCGSLE